ncbi:MAG: 50S ribosomal protein L23 [Deltaproteobacteria bacterium]|nr:50S ribosomal protein L23 [Deltaproteobacteria bacterium]
MNWIDVIKRPLVTEKATRLREAFNQYLFAVDTRASKIDVRQAVERLFRVQVMDVHTVTNWRQGRKGFRGGRRSPKLTRWKKAVVTVKSGQKIELFEGV